VQSFFIVLDQANSNAPTAISMPKTNPYLIVLPENAGCSP
jgi:hypothetical protein